MDVKEKEMRARVSYEGIAEAIAETHHMGFHKDYLIDALKRYENATEKLVAFNGEFPPSKEARRLLEEDGRKVITAGDCDNQREDGSCGGHPS